MNERDLTELLNADGEIITERLDHWGAVAGDRTFFYYGEDDETLSYGEFIRRTDAIAGNLARVGIVKGDRVSVFCKNPLISTQMMFGIWKAGAVYCPVNFGYAGRLLTYQLNDTRPTLIVTDGALLPVLNEVLDDLDLKPSIAVHRPAPDAHDYIAAPPAVRSGYTEIAWSELTKPAGAPGVKVSFDDPANLIYTSGTTGPSKGVVQPYRWMTQYTFGLRSLLNRDDVIYNDLPMYHVGGAIANVCRAVWVGCEVAVWNRFSPDGFWDRIAARRATTAILLDVMIPWLEKAPPTDDDRRNTLNKVHMQPLPLHHHQFASRFGIDFVTAGFGQTEAGVGLTSFLEETRQGEGTPDDLYRGYSHAQVREIAVRMGTPLLPGDGAARKGLMGVPTAFMEVSIRDEMDEECGDEVAGHLCLRPRLPGILFHSYLGKPEATVSAFRNLWFHTGDAALRGRDGMYYYVDRLGDRIRVRGENLSSFQVEDMINQHPSVQMSAAVAIPSDEGEEDQVVAYVVGVAGGVVTEAAIHAFAAETMPKYMRPRHVRIVDDLPRTPTNKVEKYKLRQLILAELKAGKAS
ncbi:MAG: AMP-binding protein [Xanthobacteraceae bacterium]|nr:AMP-binding protein [Xanthobacteraceae bacterium]